MSISSDYRSGMRGDNTHLTHARFRGGASIDDNLGDSDYVETLPKYIAKRLRIRLLDKSYAMKEGLGLVGSRADSGSVFGTQRGKLFHTAKSSSRRKAGEILHKNAVKNLLTTKFKTKSGVNINVRFVAKNIYVREVKSSSGISYTQARNTKTGRVTSLKKALKITKN
jgi:hypothetical protein